MSRCHGDHYDVTEEEKARFARDGYVHLEGILSEDEMQKIVSEIYDFARNPETLIGGPRIFQAWGSVPS